MKRGMSRFRKALTLFDDYYEMMSDSVRTQAYKKAIAQVVQPGDVVLDLGAGLGILTFLALRAGAARVYAVEKSDSVELLRNLVASNGFEDRVVVIAESSRDVELDEKVDVILSETLGSFALDENTVAFTMDVRDRLLKPDGKLLPLALRTYLAPVNAPQSHKKIDFWRSVEGFDYTRAQQECVSRMSLTSFESKNLVAEPLLFADVDLEVIDDETLANKLLFPLTRKSTVHGLAGWFEADLCDGVTLSTAPDKKRTHWQQAFFPFKEPVDVVRGDYLEVVFRVAPESERSDNTQMQYDYRCTQTAKG
jgi:SAM-dependent methyltransferase